MEISFTRTGARTHRTQACRDDGVVLLIPAYDRTSPMPHDYAHFIVESELGLEQGFWGLVSDGAIFPGMKVLEGRLPPRAAERSREIQRSAGQKGNEAEVLVGTLYTIAKRNLDRDWRLVARELKEMWRPAMSALTPLSPDQVAHVCAALREAQARWSALETGATLTVVWKRTLRRSREKIRRSA